MSYSFQQVTQFKVGERYWESSQHGNINFEVVSEPLVTGEAVSFLARDVNSGREYTVLMTKGFEHYGPKIYDEPAYVSLKEIRRMVGSFG